MPEQRREALTEVNEIPRARNSAGDGEASRFGGHLRIDDTHLITAGIKSGSGICLLSS